LRKEISLEERVMVEKIVHIGIAIGVLKIQNEEMIIKKLVELDRRDKVEKDARETEICDQ
jgi:hypothetical protein